MSLPHILAALTEREAVTDALYRAMYGFDLNDVALFDSAFTGADSVLEITNRVITGLDDIRAKIFYPVGAMDTTHMISNVRVDVKDGASSAFLTACSLAQHCPPGRGADPHGPKYLGGTMYLIDLVKDQRDEMWKIKKWVMKGIWGEGDSSVMAGVL